VRETHHDIRMRFYIEITDDTIALAKQPRKFRDGTDMVTDEHMLEYAWDLFLAIMREGIRRYEDRFRQAGLTPPRVFWEPDCDYEGIH